MVTASRGTSLLPISLALTSACAGLALGLSAYAFHYAKGTSYMGNDPATCANCHVMNAHYTGWLAGPHRHAATCNDCHTPAAFIPKYIVKGLNGYHHSKAFTLGGYPDVIRARPESAAIVEENCRRCHQDMVDSITGGEDVACVRCHQSAGHLR